MFALFVCALFCALVLHISKAVRPDDYARRLFANALLESHGISLLDEHYFYAAIVWVRCISSRMDNTSSE